MKSKLAFCVLRFAFYVQISSVAMEAKTGNVKRKTKKGHGRLEPCPLFLPATATSGFDERKTQNAKRKTI
jgi:hypothetical protein